MSSSVQSVRPSRLLLASNSLYQVFYVRIRETAKNKSNHTIAETTNPEGKQLDGKKGRTDLQNKQRPLVK